ncbi:sodium/bile acid cotransporter 4 [Hemicordylus capensis]|uniref:sodium/bile acid cotransporter 4 n=1 Tax=Hemicordylus capensis TaxID=884348 RepID=UPI002303F0FF|nr:sodium/bile acid cotransporter 4 [Hemicordylus capensis]
MNSSWTENGTSSLFPFPERGNSTTTSSSTTTDGSSASLSLSPPMAPTFLSQLDGGGGGSSSPPFWDTPLNQGLSVFVGLALCVTMLGLGCTVELSQLGAQLRRPLGLLLALLCQFGVMPLVAFLLALIFALDEVAAVAVLLCGCCPGGNLSNIVSLLVDGDMNLSIIMTMSSTLLALILMPLCLWIYSRAWINTPLVRLLPLGAVTLTLCSTLLPIGIGVFIRYRYTRLADILLKVSLWSLLVSLVILFILTGTMLGPELLARIPATVYVVAVLMPLMGYGCGYGIATLFRLPPHCKRTVSLETGCQNVQLCTAILKLTFPPQLIGSMYIFPLLYALFQAAEAGLFVLAYNIIGKDFYKQEPLGGEEEDTDISYKKLKEEEVPDTSYGTVTAEDHGLVLMEPTQTAL